MCSPGVSARDRVLAQLATLGPATGDALNLLTQVRELATFADQVQGELARLAGLVDRSNAYVEAGYSSAAAFLRHGCGRSPGRAGELVALGRALPRLAATGQAVADGTVSFDAAHVIGRATAQISDDDLAAAAEQELLAAATATTPPKTAAEDAVQPSRPWVASALDPRELRRLGADLTYRADPDGVEERQRQRFERRYLCFGLTLDDVGTISGACSDALSLEIIRTAAEAFGPPGGAEDQRTAAQRRMDGLTAACQAALDSGRAGVQHGALPHLTVLFDAAAGPVAGPTGGPAHPGSGASSGAEAGSGAAAGSGAEAVHPGSARTSHGTVLTARQILTLVCRAEISLIRWREGLPMDVGRRYRTETPAQRRALTARDRGCRWPGCGMPAVWCTAHHIRPWKRGGRTRLPDLILLCFVHHHYFIHLLGWILTGTADSTLQFTHPRGHLTLTSPLPAQPASRSP
ncbi:MAG TPA: DUF222 domain-containing protein [Streptosporangiaceae bacterium]